LYKNFSLDLKDDDEEINITPAYLFLFANILHNYTNNLNFLFKSTISKTVNIELINQFYIY
jgi:hypothetical protein